ncbi:MAG: hypothetical protein KF766_02735, partial [Rhodocyclaceae bacterium]|nr:hypothetical protein [Rhodocyclaceae bacterium]
ADFTNFRLVLKMGSRSIELQDRTNNAKPGFQWNAIYGPPSNRLNLFAQLGNHANRSEFLAIELVAKY